MTQRPIHVLVYQLPRASRLSSTLVAQVMEEANRSAEQPLFQYQLSDQPAALDAFQGAHIILCGDNQWPHQSLLAGDLSAALVEKSAHCRLLALGSGVALLADSGLLDGQRAATPWQMLDGLRARYPRVQFSSHLFEWSERCVTCAGELASVHLMLHWLRKVQGVGLASEVADRLQCERIRSGDDRQKVPLQTHLGAQDPKLLEGVALMEANIEEPLATSEIADYLSISRRQLERLFKKYLQEVPSRYYLNLRLDAAKRLLLESNLSIVEISGRCGFSSGPHFSTAYRQRFNLTPREERSQFMNRSDTHE
ncbi:helix-turn-helix domain-containing protein [Simiduia sp. 21SJ11W-1]|uniref:GlxA family transcriptional regulator n=1 Tax=Simiduia sp. 21SJ11W-1 TaxID=2909669 RepID=UPI0020A088B6|nr:helix-turn-helix domain-containing protein [Simiduia sp. 21SJ11W-1]UTA47717.1 helix-turn-helix domain-containing protein [Simiduia sp. 21SJ11W-1]